MSCGRSPAQPARWPLCREPGHSSTAPWGKGSQGLRPVLRAEKHRELTAPAFFMWGAVPVLHVHVAHRGTQTRSKSAVPSRAALAHFSLKLWLLGCRTSLAPAVPRQARQHPGVCSADPHQSHILASLFCHPFHKAQHHGGTREALSECHFPAALQLPSRRGVTFITAALTGLNSSFLRSFGGL